MSDAQREKKPTLGERVFGEFSWRDGSIPPALAGQPVPLKIGVIEDVKALLPGDQHEAVQTAIARWTRGAPYLIAILAAVGMFRASGLMERVAAGIGWVTEPLGLPAEALPLALLRPLSGSGGFGLTAELIETHGPDSYLGNLVSTMNGSTDTTFYVIAVYFGSVGVTRFRHGVAAGLTADFFGVVGSITLSRWGAGALETVGA